MINSTLELIKSAIIGGSALFSVDNLKSRNYTAPVVQTNGFSVTGNLINLNIQIYIASKSNIVLHDLIESTLISANGVVIGNQRLAILTGEIYKDTDLFTCVLSGTIQIPNIPDPLLIESLLGSGSLTFNENCTV